MTQQAFSDSEQLSDAAAQMTYRCPSMRSFLRDPDSRARLPGRLSRYALAGSLLLSVAACPSEDHGEREREAAAPHSAASDERGATPEPGTGTGQPPALGAGGDLVKATQTVLDRCTVDKATGWIKGCPGSELDTLRKLYEETGLIASLRTLSIQLAAGDERTKNFICSEFYDRFARHESPPRFYADVAQGKRRIDRETATRLIRGLYGLNETAAGHLVPVATHAATLTDQVDLLLRAIREMPYPGIRHTAYRNLLVMGRLTHFPITKRLATSGESRDIRSALNAVLNLPDPTDEELKIVCPWASQFLKYRHPKIVGAVGRLMSRCGGAWTEGLISEAEDRLARKRFLIPRELVGVLGTVCAKGAKGASCERVSNLLRRIVEDEQLDWDVRGYAVSSIAHRAPTRDTLRLMRHYERSKVPHIKAAAKAAIVSLSTLQNIRDGQAIDPPPTAKLPSWTMTAARFALGARPSILCPPNGTIGLVVGSSPYAGSSSICSAAVHDGKITRTKGGSVGLRIVKAPRSNRATEAYGVSSVATGPATAIAFKFTAARSAAPRRGAAGRR